MKALSALRESFSSAWDFLIRQVTAMNFWDLIDIAIVAVLLYYIYKFICDRRAGKLAVGVIVLVLLQLVSDLLEMNALRFIMQNVFQVGVLALIIVFQPELRSALEKVGGEPLKGLKSIGESRELPGKYRFISEMCDAVNDLSRERTGALIVIERSTKLGDIIKSGVVVNAEMSSFLLKNIFFNKAPLHDGAVVIRGDRIYAAGCFLPLSSNEDIIKDLGSRHRAGIGMSENSDALVIIVSEETGTISVAEGGNLKRNFNYNTLKTELERIYTPAETGKKRISFGKNENDRRKQK